MAAKGSILKNAAPGVLAGLIYGAGLQALGRAGSDNDERILMTLAFVFILPFVMGALTMVFAGADARKSWAYRILMPWAATALAMLTAYIWQWEGSICLVLGLPVYLTLSSIGGILAGFLLTKTASNKMRLSAAVFLAALPPAAGRVEMNMPLPEQTIETATHIDIAAPPAAVWANIIRVPAITEEQSGFFYRIGFPKPVEATLSKEGEGAVRHASFERGLVFIETVHTWIPRRTIAFRIDVDPAHTPLTTLDPHVTVGGLYFDVLEGRYDIEPLASGVRLHLKSEHRLSTHFNWYASLWSALLMKDIQNSILLVIKQRAESQSKN